MNPNENDFKGLYSIIDLKKNFNSPIILRLNVGAKGKIIDRKISEFLGVELMQILTGHTFLKETNIGNEEIDQLFSVQSNDRSSADQLVNDHWIELLLKLRKVYNVRFDACFTGNKLHLAFYGLNMNEQQAWVSYEMESPSNVIIHQYNVCLAIVEDIAKANL